MLLDTFVVAIKFVCIVKFLLMFYFLFIRETSDNLGQPVNCVSMSNDGNCILAGCLDSTLRLLDRYFYCIFGKITMCLYPCNFHSPFLYRSTGELLQEYKGHTNKVSPADA